MIRHSGDTGLWATKVAFDFGVASTPILCTGFDGALDFTSNLTISMFKKGNKRPIRRSRQSLSGCPGVTPVSDSSGSQEPDSA